MSIFFPSFLNFLATRSEMSLSSPVFIEVGMGMYSIQKKPASYILVVDDDEDIRSLFKFLLENEGYEVVTAPSCKDCFEIIRKNKPGLIILDILLPGEDGIEILKKLRGNPQFASIPVILISALRDTDHIVRGLQAGANDYVTKPINGPILLARIETHLKLGSLVNRLKRQKDILSKMAALDELTGIYNRRFLFDILTSEIERKTRYKRSLSLLMMDIDHFKRVNDKHGHPVGDKTLQRFVDLVGTSLRSNDVFCRYGGEEFCAILPETDTTQAEKVAKRIQSSIEETSITISGIQIYLTVSIGVVTSGPDHEQSAWEIIEHSDKALYMAKRNGRNCVEVYNALKGK